MKRSYGPFAVVFFGGIFVLGLGIQTKSEAEVTMRPGESTTGEKIEQKMDDFRKDMKLKLNRVGEDISRLEKKAENKGDQASAETKRLVSKLKQKKEDLEDYLSDMEDGTEDAYYDMKLRVEHGYEDLKNEIHKALN